MSITLTTTWYPRGELPRLTRMLPALLDHYAGIVISYIPGRDTEALSEFNSGSFASDSRLTFFVNHDQSMGRYMALQKALQISAEYIHYADMDRLLHWVETRPEEWLYALAQIEKFDCIIFGRTETAMQTHPQALIATEKLSNQVVSHFMANEMDVSAGSKSFCRSAAQHLVDHGIPHNSIGTDAEWPILLKQAGYQVEYLKMDGLDWESADHYQLQAASPPQQKQAALEYDARPEHWLKRVEVADTIIHAAFDTSGSRMSASLSDNYPVEFNFDAVFEADDYLYFYSESLTDARADAEVSALVSLLKLDSPKRILDLACGFGRHTNRLAALGHSVTGIDITPGFLDIARQDAIQRKVDVIYQQGDMRRLSFDNKFDYVLLLFTAFGYFSDAENLQVLVNVRNALKPGGSLIFDIQNRDTFLKSMHPYFVVEKEGNLMIDCITFDHIMGRSINKRFVIRDGIRKEKPFSIRLYNPTDIHVLLTHAGLELDELYAGWDASLVTNESRRLVVIARKP